MAFSLVPATLWTLYQQRDGFDTFMITIVFAAYALGVIVSLFFAGRLSERFGRRAIMLPSILLGFFLLCSSWCGTIWPV
jgi:MFS family permease